MLMINTTSGTASNVFNPEGRPCLANPKRIFDISISKFFSPDHISLNDPEHEMILSILFYDEEKNNNNLVLYILR